MQIAEEVEIFVEIGSTLDQMTIPSKEAIPSTHFGIFWEYFSYGRFWQQNGNNKGKRSNFCIVWSCNSKISQTFPKTLVGIVYLLIIVIWSKFELTWTKIVTPDTFCIKLI